MVYVNIPYKDYLASALRDLIRKGKLQKNTNCEICKKTANVVHHLSYERLGVEKWEDLASVCFECHDVLHKEGQKNEFNEQVLRERFDYVKTLLPLDSIGTFSGIDFSMIKTLIERGININAQDSRGDTILI